ncbi:wd-40 repeat protein [Stylonychia lemnae]|uniref:Wd-40 repeat protein n=1 Tax=Stylonychia lemnae TaxID=5949 RepID=A0A078AVK6_STYLE|nr:wd-40 repeat protein [Stylonychia lemnae]|eukprot:CDW85302.1 wd-40 repeat protein [Stylonychia lemnae]
MEINKVSNTKEGNDYSPLPSVKDEDVKLQPKQEKKQLCQWIKQNYIERDFSNLSQPKQNELVIKEKEIKDKNPIDYLMIFPRNEILTFYQFESDKFMIYIRDLDSADEKNILLSDSSDYHFLINLQTPITEINEPQIFLFNKRDIDSKKLSYQQDQKNLIENANQNNKNNSVYFIKEDSNLQVGNVNIENHFAFVSQKDSLDNKDIGTVIYKRDDLSKVKKLDSRYKILAYNQNFKYAIDKQLNLYALNEKFELDKKQFLQHFKSEILIDAAIHCYCLYLITKFEEQNLIKIYNIFTFELVSKQSFSLKLEFENFDFQRLRFYFFEPGQLTVSYIQVYTQSYQLNSIIPLKGIDSDISSVFGEYLFFENNENDDVVQRIDQQSPLKVLAKAHSRETFINLIAKDSNLLYAENFDEIVNQSKPQLYQVQKLSKEDVICYYLSSKNKLFLNDYRSINFDDVFKNKQEQQDIQRLDNKISSFNGLMSSKGNWNGYVIEICSPQAINYFNKNTQLYKQLILKEKIPKDIYDSIAELKMAYIDEDFNILMFHSKLKLNNISSIVAFDLVTLKIIQEMSFTSNHQLSVNIGEDFVQISDIFLTQLFFFNTKNQEYLNKNNELQNETRKSLKIMNEPQLKKIIKISSGQISKFKNTHSSQQDLSSSGYFICKNLMNDANKYIAIEQKPLSQINDVGSYNQPLILALYFELAQTIQIDQKRIEYYMNYEDNPAGILDTNIDDDILQKFKDIKQMKNVQVIEQLKDLKTYTKFISGYGNCFNLFENNLRVLESITKSLSLLHKRDLPILIIPKMLNGQSPFDFATQNRQQKILNLILHVIIKYQNHILFNQLIDKHICELIEYKIDLQDYFESHLPFYEIIDPNFPSQHYDDRALLVGTSLQNLKEIHLNYEQLFKDVLFEKPENEESSNVSIEYFIVNLPYTLNKNANQLMQVLSDTQKQEYLENQIIQSIIQFKWRTHTRVFYFKNFFIYMIFIFAFIFETFYSAYYGLISEELDGDLRNIWVRILIKFICFGVIVYFLIYEYRQFKIQKFSYFMDLWNYFDLSYIISYVILTIVEFSSTSEQAVIILHIIAILLSSMKLFQFLRIFQGFSFLVSMLQGVFMDLRFFLGFFLIFIFQFGLVFTILFRAKFVDGYKGVGKLTYFLTIFRISTGDFELDDYKDQDSELVFITWVVWVFTVLIINIVFMNFIIAVISESYEKVMQKLVAESYKVKANLILEREQLFSEQELKNPVYFPNYIVIRRQVNTTFQEDGEWQGFIKDIKGTMKIQTVKQKNEIISSFGKSQNKVQVSSIEDLVNEQKKLKEIIEQLIESKKPELQQQQVQNYQLPANYNQIQQKVLAKLNQYKDNAINKEDFDNFKYSVEIENRNVEQKLDEVNKKVGDTQTQINDLKMDMSILKSLMSKISENLSHRAQNNIETKRS